MKDMEPDDGVRCTVCFISITARDLTFLEIWKQWLGKVRTHRIKSIIECKYQ
jgi:hypothetical protein